MADDYIIKARYVVEDGSAPGLASVRTGVGGLESFIRSSAGRMTALFGGIFAGAGVTTMLRGIIGLNSEIQTAEAGLATLFNAQTGMPIAQSMRLARTEIAALRRDAAVGVGELSNYLDGYQRLLGPGLAAGQSTEQIRKLTREALAAGFALRGDQGLWMAPQDVLQGMTSGASERTTPILMQALSAAGMSADKFNAMDPAAKMAAMSDAFAMFGPGIEVMGRSWDAQMGTFRDHLKEITRSVTSPIFDRWTEQLRAANSWLAANQERVSAIAASVGDDLVRVWDHVIERARIYAAIAGAATVAPAVSPLVSGGRGAMAALAGGGGGAFLSSLAPLAAVLAAVGAGAFSVWAAIERWPSLLGDFTGVANEAGVAFGQITEQLAAMYGPGTLFGELLTWVGAGLVTAATGLLQQGADALKGVALIALAARGFSQSVGLVATGVMEALAMLADGNVGGARARINAIGGEHLMLLKDMRKDAREIVSPRVWADARSPGGGEEEVPQPPKAPQTNVNIGSVEVKVASEVNADPARVAVAFDEVLRHLDRYRLSAQRSTPRPA